MASFSYALPGDDRDRLRRFADGKRQRGRGVHLRRGVGSAAFGDAGIFLRLDGDFRQKRLAARG
jgi:hypothetical protein